MEAWQAKVAQMLESLTVDATAVDATTWALRRPGASDVLLGATPAGIRLSTPAETMPAMTHLLLQATREWSAGTVYAVDDSAFVATGVPFDAEAAADTRAKHIADAYRRVHDVATGLRRQAKIVDPLPKRPGSDAPLEAIAHAIGELGLEHFDRDGDVVVAIDPGDGARFVVSFGHPAPGWIAVDAWPTSGHERPYRDASAQAFANHLNSQLMLGSVVLVADDMPRWRAYLPEDQVLGPGAQRVRYLIDHAAGATLELIKHARAGTAGLH